MEEKHAKRHLLVDFENVQKLPLSTLLDDCEVTVFVGNGQKNIPLDIVLEAQSLGIKMEWIRAEGVGKNALDFHIAYYLGRLLLQQPQKHFFILSRDSGFDPLVNHLQKQGMHCCRISSLTEIKAKPQGKVKSTLPIASYYERAVAVLTETEDNFRPRKRTSLANHLFFRLRMQSCGRAEVERLLNLLIYEGKVIETNESLTYALC